MKFTKKSKRKKTIFLKWSPKKKIQVLFGMTGCYAIVVLLLEICGPWMLISLESFGEYWNKESTDSQPKMESRSKLIEEKPTPPPFLIDKTKFPAELNHRLLFEEVEHGAPYLEQASFFNILHQIATMTQHEIIKAFEKQQQEEVITMPHLFQIPEHIVGRFVHFSGSLIKLSEVTVSKNEWGVTKMWEGQFMDREYNIVSFQVLDEPVNLHAHCDKASITGIFFKLWASEVEAHSIKLNPLIIGRKLSPIK
ncbi:MAG: hypothetical protein AABZ60_20285 [Planctomycetota bacterium]